MESQALAELETGEVDVDELRDVRRQSLDVELACDLLDYAAELRPRRLADEAHEHGGLDRLVESDLVEVDVRDRAPDRMLLVVLEHGMMWCLLAVDQDIDDPVEAGRPGQGDPELPLTHDEGLVRLPVEDAGNQALTPQALDVAGAELVGSALLDLENDSVPGHGGEV